MNKTFVGYGFGPIQSGLMLYEAYRSGHFDRFVVSEIDDALVDALASAGGAYTVNIARPDRIDRYRLEGIELYSPRRADHREALLEAIAASDEQATALPSVKLYDTGEADSVAALLAEGLARRSGPVPTILYASENHNHAAEMLTGALSARTGGPTESFQALNTVIGKMSGVIADPEVIERMDLTTITPEIPRAILIEEFNRILVSRVTLPRYRRGIDVFETKPDLLPFEEAKLFGHNAVHATIAYLADLRGHATVAEAGRDEWIMSTAREAFEVESGQAMLARWGDTGDELFTPAGYRRYAEDLLERMTNPHLNDLVARVGRDPARKLAWDDRLYGTMRRALLAGIEPRRLALGAAAGLRFMVRRREELPDAPPPSLPAGPDDLTPDVLPDLLGELWGDDADPGQAEAMIALTAGALEELQATG
jgi:mannitol-1-phosphate 5-dehydrogenase